MNTKKNRKGLLVMISIIFLISLSTYAKAVGEEVVLPIYISEETRPAQIKQGMQQLSLESGWNEESLAIAVGLDQEKNRELLNQLIRVLPELKGKRYLHLYGLTQEAQQQVKVIYEGLLAEISIAENTDLQLELVYTLRNKEDVLFKQMPYIHALNVNTKKQEDRALLEFMNKQYSKDYTLIATDDLAKGYGQAVSEGLDAISSFYYDTPFDYSDLDIIFRPSDLSDLPAKYTTFYKGLENVCDTAYRPLQKDMTIKDGNLQFLVRTHEKVEYMEYKINEEAGGQSFRYPYAITIDQELLHKGINEIKVVMKLKGEDQYSVQRFYMNNQANLAYDERSPRKMQAYDKSQKPSYKKPYIPVLMYHKFKDQVENTKEDQSMSVSTSLFEAQLKALLEAGYTTINFKQLQDYLEGRAGLPKKPVLITADDGYLCNYTKAYPILKKYNAQATFFVTSLYVGVTNENEHFTWEQAKEMEASGLIDIQSHTHGHTLMNVLKQSDVLYEVQKSFADIEKYLGKRDVKVLAYPQFLHTAKVKEWVKSCGVDLQVTNLVSKYKPSSTQPLDIKRIHVSNELSPTALIKEMK